MNNTVRYVLVAVLALLGIARLSGVVVRYNESAEIDWWALSVGVIFIGSSVLQYARIRKNAQ